MTAIYKPMVKSNTTLIREKAEHQVQLAHSKFGVKLPDFSIKFDLRGKSGGQAYRKGHSYGIRLNVDLIENNFDDVLHNIIPHEIAHLVCYVAGWPKGHGKEWKMVCIGLGGDGSRTHDLPTVASKVYTKYRYVATNGTTVELTRVRHNRIQNGGVYGLKDGGKIHRLCQWSVV